MEVGDTVRHKKYGTGIVKALYPKHDAARVKYESGHETTNARKRLAVVPAAVLASQGAATTKREESGDPSVKATRKSGAGAAAVDYALLERAQRHFRDLFPEAARVVARIYNKRPYCEIWDEKGAAKIIFYEEAK